MSHLMKDKTLYNDVDSTQRDVHKDSVDGYATKTYGVPTESENCQLEVEDFGAEHQLSEKHFEHCNSSHQQVFTQVSPIGLHCCLRLSKNVLQEKRFKKTISQCSEFDKNYFMHLAVNICMHQRQRIVPFIFGILVGITLTALLFQQHVIYTSSFTPWTIHGARRFIGNDSKDSAINVDLEKDAGINEKMQSIAFRANQEDINPIESNLFPSSAKSENALKTKLYVGVITAEKFLASRSLAVNNTWGGQVDKIEFFTQHGSSKKYGIPVVNLERVSDTEYPPQKKAFEMLKYMCNHRINDFEWFIRADDDVYIRVKRLKRFLAQIDSERLIYMGQPGHGVPEVRQKLGLDGHNFCMGGPGVIFNRKALKALCPHVDECMRDVMSKEEDVEIGRCVTKHLHIECTHAWETLKLFYHSYQEEYTEEKPFLGNLAENEHVSYALTLHHLKLPYVMYRVHRHYTSLLLNSTFQELKSLQTSLQQTNSKLPLGQQHRLAVEKSVIAPYTPRRSKDMNIWKSFGTESVYSASPAHVMHDITNDVLADLKQIGETAIDEAVGHSEVQKFTYSHVSDGYLRSDGTRGTDYLLDIYFSSKQAEVPDEMRRVHLLRPLGEMEVSGVRIPPAAEANGEDDPFYVILAISLRKMGEFEAFMRDYYEPIFLAGGQASQARLVVVPIDSYANHDERASLGAGPYEVVSQYNIKYTAAEMATLPERPGQASAQEAYARGIAFAQEQVLEMDRARLAGTAVLLTSPNISLASDVQANCLLKTGASSGSNAYNDDISYNFINYKSRKKNAEHPIAQIYQPIPFRLHRAATSATDILPQAAGAKSSVGKVSSSAVKSDNGFWDSSAAFGEDGDAVTAPLCGRLKDLSEPARAALATLNITEKKVTFREALYERIYAGKLSILRAPDPAFLNIPRR